MAYIRTCGTLIYIIGGLQMLIILLYVVHYLTIHNCVFPFRLFFQKNVEFGNSHLLVIQCASGHINGDLIACARYRILEERAKTLEKNMIEDRVGATHVLFIINIPVKAQSLSFVSFQGGVWLCAHIDDFLPNSDIAIKPHEAYAHSVSELFIGQNPPGSSPTSEGINRHDHTAKYRRLHGYIDEVVLQLKYTSEEISLSKIAILRSLVSKEIPDSLCKCHSKIAMDNIIE